MRVALIPRARTVSIDAGACPPRDRTNRTEKALAACKDAWSEAYAQAQEKGLPTNKALRMAQVAYKLAMPKMDTLPAIRAAIAAVAQGIQLEVFDGRDGSQLLYAAQVALSVLKTKGGKKA
jgi:hypothetical protein